MGILTASNIKGFFEIIKSSFDCPPTFFSESSDLIQGETKKQYCSLHSKGLDATLRGKFRLCLVCLLAFEN